MHVNNRRITTGLGSDTDIRQSNRINTTRLQVRKRNRNDKQHQGNKAILYMLLSFEQVFKKMQDQAVLIRSNNSTAVYDIGKWKAKESLIKRLKKECYLLKRLQLQITTIDIPGKLNSATDSLSRLYRQGGVTDDELKQSTGNNNSTDLARTTVVHQTKEFVHQVPFPWIIRENFENGTENEKVGSKTSSRQCGRLPSGTIDWLDIERITIEETMKRDAEVEPMIQLGNQQVIQAKIIKGQT
ncbi:MAG: hypothetical protein EZS28_033336, partial [Streblomastix strix]